MKKTIFIMFILAFTLMGQAQEVIDYLHVGKTLKFQGTKFELKWCSHPIEQFYLQEWLPKGEEFENYNQMFSVSLSFTEELSTAFFVEAKVKELEERAKTDKCCHYNVYENNGEYIIDFMVSVSENGYTKVVEADIHYYKSVVVDGKKAIQLNFYSHRAYGDDIIPFMKSLEEKRPKWIHELIKKKIVCKMK